MTVTAVERAVATARTFDSIDDYRIKETISGLQKKRGALLGVEKEAQQGIEKELAFLARDLKRVESWRRHGLPMLAEEVLTWRSGTRENIALPTFALTSLDDPETRFEVSGEWFDHNWSHKTTSCRPSIPAPLDRNYTDVFEQMKARSRARRSNISLFTSYSGVIPDSTRKRIEDAPFEEIFLLREVEEWGIKTKKVERPPRPRHVDPIVVGFDAASLWIIDTFDPTPLEQYVRDEFALLAGSGLALIGPGSNN